MSVQNVYHHEKFSLIGVLKPHQDSWRYVRFVLSINLHSQDIPKLFGDFEIDVKVSGTAVYIGDVKYEAGEGKMIHLFYRPGKWESYIKTFVEKRQSEVMENRKLDGVPVNDETLFSDE